MTWLVSASATLDSDVTIAVTNTIRQFIPAADIANAGKALVRGTFKASSAVQLITSKVFIGQGADAGDNIDFQATPTELLFGGGHGFTCAAGATIVSDPAVFTIPAGKPLVLSWYLSTAGGGGHQYGTNANWLTYYKAGDDAATVNISGYAAFGANGSYGVLLIEASTIGGESFIDLSGYGRMCELVKEKVKKYWQGWSLKNGLFQPESGLSF